MIIFEGASLLQRTSPITRVKNYYLPAALEVFQSPKNRAAEGID
jgi:hypothetical protein